MAGSILERTQEIVQHKQTQGLQLLANAHEAFGASARRSRAYMLGRDDKGKVIDTYTPASLDIIVKGWFVQTIFKKDDLDALAGIDWRDVEAMIKQRAVPQKPVSESEGHIITATRQLKDIRQQYERSLGKDDAGDVKADVASQDPQVLAFYQLNIGMSNKSNTASVQDIWIHIKTLEGFRSIFENKKTALGRFVGLGRLEEAIRKFRSAAHAQPDERSFAITAACAVFNSVNERQTTWKNKHNAEMAARTFGRECSLRVERDRWFHEICRKWASNVGRLQEFMEEDEKKKNVLAELKEKIPPLCALQKTIAGMKARKHQTDEHRTEIRQKENEFKTAINDAHKYMWEKAHLFSKDGEKPRRLTGHYFWINRYLLQRDFESMADKIDGQILFLDSNKPGFVLDALSQNVDPYLETALGAFKFGVVAFEAKDFKEATRQFWVVESEMCKIVYPQADKDENKNGLPLSEHIQKG
ncbi:MAG: hypothetical protein PHF60_01935 [Candidatus ainarchaeum sp.]|nr:hypothetical protein [Candidatus ainarchaeum sp.]